MPRRRSWVRMARLEYALSAQSRLGLVRGAPPLERPTFQVSQQVLKEWGVVGLTGRDQHHQRSPQTVDEVMDLAGQTATGTANAVVRRLDAEILVIRPSTLCGG
jgi:hypothetical protein